MLAFSSFEAVVPCCERLQGYAVQCRHIFDVLCPLSEEDSKIATHIQCYCTCPARVVSTIKLWGRCKTNQTKSCMNMFSTVTSLNLCTLPSAWSVSAVCYPATSTWFAVRAQADCMCARELHHTAISTAF